MNAATNASPPPFPVFFSPRMVAPSGGHSPSAEKPARVVQSWLDRGLEIQIVEPTPATAEQLSLAHDAAHVTSILACRKENGFGNRSAEVAASLPYTSGAMLSAARHVLEHGGAASAPCSGFHHAGYGFVGGFCTFNGLMVVALALKAAGRASRVGILDCDQHYGNGTDDIIAKTSAGGWVRHFTAGKEFSAASQAGAFFRRLRAELAAMADCDLVLYQAGADPHVNDPLGGWLTTEQLRERDAVVFSSLAAAGVPVVWNLAGGYQREPDGSIPRVLEIHDNTALEWIRSARSPRATRDAADEPGRRPGR